MEAAAFMEGDPAVREGLMTATLHPFRVSLFEGEDGAAAGTQARPRV